MIIEEKACCMALQHAFCELFRENRPQVDLAPFQHADRHGFFPGIRDRGTIPSIVQGMHQDHLFDGVHDPIFLHAGPLVEAVFYNAVMPKVGGGEDLDDQGRGTPVNTFDDLAVVTDKGKIGLYYGVNILWLVLNIGKELDIERGGNYIAAFSPEMRVELNAQL